MKKTLILTDRFYPEEFFINDFLPEFTRRGIDLEVLTQVPSYPFGKVSAFIGYKNKLFSKENHEGIPVYRVITIPGYKTVKFLKVIHYLNFAILCSLVMLFIGKRYDRIFIFQTGPLTQALPAIFAKKLFGCRVLIWTLDIWPDTVFTLAYNKTWLLEKIINVMIRFIYRNSDEILISSPGFYEPIRRYCIGNNIHFMPQWVKSVNDNQDAGILLDPAYFHFTFTGNVAKTQNLETVVSGFDLAHKKVKGIRLNIFGDGRNLDELKTMVRERDIKDVIFWGRRPQKEMPGIFRQSQVLIVSLKPDPLFNLYLPLKFTSYLDAGKPILAILNGQVSQLVREFRIGLTADPSDPVAVGESMLRFCNMQPEELKEYGLNTEKIRKDLFDQEKILGQFFNIFEKLK